MSNLKIKIKNKTVSSNNVFTIAEIGINHNGSFEVACKMIDYAKKAGFDAIKLQKYDIKEMLIPNTALVDYQKRSKFINMNSMLEKNNLSDNEFIKIKKYCEKIKIIFLATPFDIKSVKFLANLKVDAFKVSSGDFDNLLLHEEIKKTKKTVILSTGMSSINQTKNILKKLKYSPKKSVVLHCISDYPTSLENLYMENIKKINNLGYLSGFSDHTESDIASYMSLCFGACLIEKHITLDKSLPGPDHKSSLECKDLDSFIKNIKSIKKGLHRKRELTKKELSTAKLAKKALYYNHDLKKGDVVIKKYLTSMRPLNKGISPIKYKSFLNKKLKKNVKKFQILNIKHFI